MPDGKRAAVWSGGGTGAVVVRMGMKRFLLAVLLCFFVCYPASAFAKKQIQNLTFSSIEDILPIFPMMYKAWNIEKGTESIENDRKSVSYLLSDTVGIVATGKITGEISGLIVFVTFDKKNEEHESALKFLEDSVRAVNVIAFMSVKNFTSKKYSELSNKLIDHLSLKNSDILNGKPADANIKKQGIKLEARFVNGTYFVTADAIN